MPKILIADDDEDLVTITKDRLEAHGFDVLSVYEGLDAVELAQNEKPDLVLLDWRMPTGKGSAVLEMLAEKEETKHIPVIVLSGVDEPGMIETATSMGARSVIRKPCDHDELLKQINNALA